MNIYIKHLERYVDSGIVIIIYYSAELIDGDFIANYQDQVCLSSPDPENFIPYNDITEQIAMNWLLSKINVDYIQSYLEKIIEKLKNPPTQNGIPWQ